MSKRFNQNSNCFNFGNNALIRKRVNRSIMFSKKVMVICRGCEESRLDSARVREFMVRNGYFLTEKIEEADIIFFRSCGLTNETIDDNIDLIESLKAKKRSDCKLFVWGCLPKIDKERVSKVYDGVTFDAPDLSLLNDLVKAKTPIEKVTANACMDVYEPKKPGTLSKLDKRLANKYSLSNNNSIFNIKVSSGCLGSCTFCNVRRSRGTVKSKSIPDILAEFQDGLSKGFHRFGLMATDVGSYGRDQGKTLVDLLSELMKVEGDYQFGLRNFNPFFLKEMFEDLKPFFASGKIWFMSTSVESGSDKLLKLMGRRYSVQDFTDCVKFLNENYPKIELRTQVIVGFPHETDEDHELTKELLAKLHFDWVEIYRYSPNSGTIAAKMENQVSDQVKMARSRDLMYKTRFQNAPRKLIKFLL